MDYAENVMDSGNIFESVHGINLCVSVSPLTVDNNYRSITSLKLRYPAGIFDSGSVQLNGNLNVCVRTDLNEC